MPDLHRPNPEEGRVLSRPVRYAGMIGGTWLLLSASTTARAEVGHRVAAIAAPADRRGPVRYGERPFWLTLLTLVTCGTAGAAAADRAIARRRAGPAAPGALRRLVVGSASAVAAASAGGPAGWARLAATAAAAGLAAEAVVMSARTRTGRGARSPPGEIAPAAAETAVAAPGPQAERR